ncbi:MAG TPA: hypothetical protein VGH15_05940 [Caulobacteraceae bacterium]|jgi:hypothetical protein
MAKKADHDPAAVAVIAATLLAGRHDAEPHHIKGAVAAAHNILDEAAAPREEAAAEEPAAEAETKA